MADDSIAIKIINERDGGIKTETRTGSNKDLLNVSTKLTSVFNIAQEIVAIIKDSISGILQPIRTIVVGIGKLLVQFLRPIADMLIILLQPILLFIKPFVRIFTELMRPFRQMAYQMMRDASKAGMGTAGGTALLTGAISVLGIGFSTAIMGLMKELLKNVIVILGSFMKLFIKGLGELLKPLLPDKWVDDTVSTISGWIDTGVTEINKGMDDAYKAMYDASLKLAKDINTSITNLFAVDLSAAATAKSSIQSAINDMFNVKIPKKSSSSSSIGSYDSNTGIYKSPTTGQGYSTAFPEKMEESISKGIPAPTATSKKSTTSSSWDTLAKSAYGYSRAF